MMNVITCYDSRKGTTAAAATAMDRQFTRHGHKCTVESVVAADPTACSNADLICVGSWTQDFFFFHQYK